MLNSVGTRVLNRYDKAMEGEIVEAPAPGVYKVKWDGDASPDDTWYTDGGLIAIEERS